MFERLRVAWLKWRIGPITSRGRDYINIGVGSYSIVYAEAFYDAKGKMVGYWAYGSFDPSFLYKGEY